uniref:Uncharacterized protein n=1 Tax=Arundo donax TaxID=35708 RepID=A0A0A9FVS0_ARUDO
MRSGCLVVSSLEVAAERTRARPKSAR